MQIKMLKDGAWMANGKAVVFKKGIIYDVDEELGEKIISAGFCHTIKPKEETADKPNHLNLVTPENKAPLDLTLKSEDEAPIEDEKKGKKGKK